MKMHVAIMIVNFVSAGFQGFYVVNIIASCI